MNNQSLQEQTVAFQGEYGAYSQAAAIAHFGKTIHTQPCKTFDQVFRTVENGECNFGILPIENSLAGSIHQNYDLLLHHDLCIVGERFLRIQHCLIGLPGVSLGEIQLVISHPQALAQCDTTLKKMKLRTSATYDTAGSVKMLAEQGDRHVAAIASSHAAQVYGMQILQQGIEDNPENYTRFLVLALHPSEPQGEIKTSIVFSLHNQPGAMFKALSVFALRDIDLTKLESRPLVGKPWEYYFYIDFVGSAGDPRLTRALENLSEFAPMLRTLGSYPRHRVKEHH